MKTSEEIIKEIQDFILDQKLYHCHGEIYHNKRDALTKISRIINQSDK